MVDDFLQNIFGKLGITARVNPSITQVFLELLDGWADDAIFTSFSTVVQSYQNDGRLIMKGCVQWSSIYD